VSKFNGINWTTYNTSNSGLANNYVFSVVIDGSGNKWFATNGGVSKFDEINWTTYNNSNSGLADNRVYSIAIDRSGNKWIGTWGGGVAYLGTPTTVPEEQVQNGAPHSFELYQNYPNPFNFGTLIKYALPEESMVKLVVYNLLGQKVKVLVENTQSPGYYTVYWDGKDNEGNFLPSGIYFYRISTEDRSEVKKLILLK
jgi:hypothetical protein